MVQGNKLPKRYEGVSNIRSCSSSGAHVPSVHATCLRSGRPRLGTQVAFEQRSKKSRCSWCKCYLGED
ncbi:hypothetical protein ANANG_G00295900 [Anguilla anguilla]|uniref:Uncharacterized protein n=1 Tax=Anguilla anguilla TaxID=7936 RepID=A0A9D3LMD1_ANGAN|nr:hypothetical protein ANANG_G00295900 [Anguilla anguilla]